VVHSLICGSYTSTVANILQAGMESPPPTVLAFSAKVWYWLCCKKGDWRGIVSGPVGEDSPREEYY